MNTFKVSAVAFLPLYGVIIGETVSSWTGMRTWLKDVDSDCRQVNYDLTSLTLHVITSAAIGMNADGPKLDLEIPATYL